MEHNYHVDTVVQNSYEEDNFASQIVTALEADSNVFDASNTLDNDPIKQYFENSNFLLKRKKTGSDWLVSSMPTDEMKNNKDNAYHVCEVHTFAEIEDSEVFVKILEKKIENSEIVLGTMLGVTNPDQTDPEVWAAIGYKDEENNNFIPCIWLPPMVSVFCEIFICLNACLKINICGEKQPVAFIYNNITDNNSVHVKISCFCDDPVRVFKEIFDAHVHLSLFATNGAIIDSNRSGKYIQKALTSENCCTHLFTCDSITSFPITNTSGIIKCFSTTETPDYVKKTDNTFAAFQIDVNSQLKIGWSLFPEGSNINLISIKSFTTYSYNTWQKTIYTIQDNKIVKNNESAMKADFLISSALSEYTKQFTDSFDTKSVNKKLKKPDASFYDLQQNNKVLQACVTPSRTSDSVSTSAFIENLILDLTKFTEEEKAESDLNSSVNQMIKRSGFEFHIISESFEHFDVNTMLFNQNKFYNNFQEECNALQAVKGSRMSEPIRNIFKKIVKSRILSTIIKDEKIRLYGLGGFYGYPDYYSELQPNEGYPITTPKMNDNHIIPIARSPIACPYMKITLLPHQQDGVRWICAHERRDIDELLYEIPYTFSLSGKPGHYTCLRTFKEVSNSDINFIRGGILADEMGLGKSVQLLAAILLDDHTIKRIKKLDEVLENSSQSWEFDTFGFPTEQINAKYVTSEFNEKGERLGGTLIVCPVTMIGEWKRIISETTNIHPSFVIEFHGPNRKKYSRGDLSNALIVITSYGTVAANTSTYTSYLHKINWHRLILDEAHEIKNAITLKTKSIKSLKAFICWFVSGTPLQNNIKEFINILSLIGAENYVTANKNKYISEELEQVMYLYCLRSLMLRREKNIFDTKSFGTTSIMAQSNDKYNESERNATPMNLSVCRSPDNYELRNSQVMFKTPNTLATLPPKHVVLHKVTMSEEEMRIYNLFKKTAKSIINDQNSSVSWIQINSLMMYLRLLTAGQEVLNTDARNLLNAMIANESIHSSKPAGMSDQKFEYAKQLLKLKFLDTPGAAAEHNNYLKEDYTEPIKPDNTKFCPICLSNDPEIITHCSHYFHTDCLNTWLSNSDVCPCCREPLSMDTMFKIWELQDLQGKINIQPTQKTVPVTKFQYVISLIMQTINQGHVDPDDDEPLKIIVFSSFVRVLNIVCSLLTEHQIPYYQITGKVSNTQRTKVISEFQTTPKSSVMLCTYGAAAVGITVTAANHVILLDPWWNPFIEDQAIDRIHRIGQVRPVYVHRIIMANTIEESILKCQENKRQLAQRLAGISPTKKLVKTIDLNEIKNMIIE